MQPVPEPVTSATTPFVESACAIGGCACGQWNDWYWAGIEAAQNTPEMQAKRAEWQRGAITEDTYDDAVEELFEAMVADGRYVHRATACDRPDCERHTSPAR